MKRYLYIIAAALIFSSCGAEQEEKETTTNVTTAPADTTTQTEEPRPAKDTLADAVIKEVKEVIKETPQPQVQPTSPPPPDTFCYILTEGENNKNINAVRLVIYPNNKIKGQLKYISKGKAPATGDLNGTIKNDIITADWTYIKDDTNFYSIPVAFKRTHNALLQKPTAVDENKKPYIPEDGEYRFKFKLTDCEYFPQ